MNGCQWRIIWVNKGWIIVILDITTVVFKNSNAPVALFIVPSVSIVCKRGLFEIVNEFTFINDNFFTTILVKQGLFDILISLVMELQYPSFTVIEVHPFWSNKLQSESLVIVSGWQITLWSYSRDEEILFLRFVETR